jgi:large subunit ribosomal protein L4
MTTPLYNQEAEVIGDVELSNKIFGVPMNGDLLHQVVIALTANKRQIVAHAKGRSEVRGGGRKPWKQKGTGRARHGSIRSPIWKGGGVTHGPTKEKIYTKKINRKMARRALAIALSAKNTEKQMVVVDSLMPQEIKTKILSHILRRFSGILPGYVSSRTHSSSILLVAPAGKTGSEILRAVKNIPYADVISISDLNALHVLSSKYILIAKEALPTIEKLQKLG